MDKVVVRRIVYLHNPINDPQGTNPKGGRPCVIISVPEGDLDERGDLVRILGITSDEPERPDTNIIPLKWGPQHRSGLKRKSFAVCTWIDKTTISNIKTFGGLVDFDDYNRIANKLVENEAQKVAKPSQ